MAIFFLLIILNQSLELTELRSMKVKEMKQLTLKRKLQNQ